MQVWWISYKRQKNSETPQHQSSSFSRGHIPATWGQEIVAPPPASSRPDLKLPSKDRGWSQTLAGWVNHWQDMTRLRLDLVTIGFEMIFFAISYPQISENATLYVTGCLSDQESLGDQTPNAGIKLIPPGREILTGTLVPNRGGIG